MDEYDLAKEEYGFEEFSRRMMEYRMFTPDPTYGVLQ